MQTLHELENLVARLSADDFVKFRNWFLEYEQAKWDARIEEDIKNNKLDVFADKALQDFRNGKHSTL